MVSRGRIFEHEISDNILFWLKPFSEGWRIWIGDKSNKNHNFCAIMTPPFHGINPLNIEGWHFRNRDNTGPNDTGVKNVNAPQEDRNFYFILNENDFILAEKAYEIRAHNVPSLSQEQEQILKKYKELISCEGKLKVTKLELGNLIKDKKAWIEYMEFEVVLDLPTKIIK